MIRKVLKISLAGCIVFALLSAVHLNAFAQAGGPAAGNSAGAEKPQPASAKTALEDVFGKHFIVKTVDITDDKSLYIRAAQTVFVLLLGYLFIILLRSIINRRVKDLKVRHSMRKNIVYFISFLMLLVIFFVWVERLTSLTIFLGVASAGLALALQEALLSAAGWALITLKHPFEVGDRVEFGGVKGDVIDIRIFQTSLLEIDNWVQADQSTGRIVNIPNSAVFKKENYNYSRGFEFIWNEIKIMVTFESNYKRAEEIMLVHARKEAEGMEDVVKKRIDVMTQQYMIFYDKLSPIVYTNIKDSGVELSLRYLTEAKKRRMTQDRLSRAILDDFAAEPAVNFAYTTYRIVKD